MAKITVLPLSVGGVKAPLNLLEKLFDKELRTNNMLYPLDLASNPSYCHAVQFTVFDYTTDAAQFYDKAGQAISDFAKEVINKAPKAVGSAINAARGIPSSVSSVISSVKKSTAAQTIENAKAISTGVFDEALSQGKNILSNLTPSESARKYSAILQADSYRMKKSTPRATISLYMPDTLNISHNADYSGISFTDTVGTLGHISNAFSDSSFLQNMTNPTNALGTTAGKHFSVAAASRAAEALGNAIASKLPGATGINGTDLNSILGNAIGQIANPQIQLVYKGTELREFQLDFLFSPTSAREAEEVERIVNAFTYYSSPAYAKNGNNIANQYLIPPQIFEIKFAYTGKSASLSDAIGRVFKNTLTNVLGAQFTNTVFGSSPTKDIENAQHAKVFRVGDCVLLNVSVDYAPNGWAAYNDGYGVQTRMTLQFKEMEILTKDRMDQWNSDSTNLPPGTKENIIGGTPPFFP